MLFWHTGPTIIHTHTHSNNISTYSITHVVAVTVAKTYAGTVVSVYLFIET